MTDKNLSRVTELRNQLRAHRYLYYVKAAPVISDYQYDTLELELKKLIQEYPELDLPDCVLHTVGSDREQDYSDEIKRLANEL